MQTSPTIAGGEAQVEREAWTGLRRVLPMPHDADEAAEIRSRR